MVANRQDRAAVAARVAEQRHLAGHTQSSLAEAAKVSESLIKKVEQKKASATPAFIAAISKALRISPTTLTGQPYAPVESADVAVHGAVAVLRTELAAYDIDDERVSQVRPIAVLAKDVDQVCTWRRAASFHRLGDALPGLLGEVRAAVHRWTGPDRDRALTVTHQVGFLGRGPRLGFADR